MVAALLRHERWGLLRKLLRRIYVVRTEHNGPEPTSYVAFDRYIRSLDEHRKNFLKLNRTSLTADMLKERCSPERTPFAELMQADVFLGLDAALHVGDHGDAYPVCYWAPRTAVYFANSRPLPLFLRAEDPELRANMRIAFGIPSAVELERRVELARIKLNDFGVLSISRGFSRFNLIAATNLPVLVKA